MIHVNIVRLQLILPLYICWSSQWLQRWHMPWRHQPWRMHVDSWTDLLKFTSNMSQRPSWKSYLFLECPSSQCLSQCATCVQYLNFFRILLKATHSGFSIASMLTLCLTSWYLSSQSSAALSRNAFCKAHPRSSKERSASSHKSPVCECITSDTPLYVQLGIARLLGRLTIRTRIRSVRETIHVKF